ncbi:MAG: hypothetical protein LBF80_04060 [Spirochaetaceae bacterium]|nr:hypothetical protein [Spirochaetaceae bacterium]
MNSEAARRLGSLPGDSTLRRVNSESPGGWESAGKLMPVRLAVTSIVII